MKNIKGKNIVYELIQIEFNCPICNEELDSLLLLNQHLDLLHSPTNDSLPNDPTESIRKWFKKTQNNLHSTIGQLKKSFEESDSYFDNQDQDESFQSTRQESSSSFLLAKERVLKRSSSTVNNGTVNHVKPTISKNDSPSVNGNVNGNVNSNPNSIRNTNTRKNDILPSNYLAALTSSVLPSSSSNTTLPKSSSQTFLGSDFTISRLHWQKETGNDICNQENCKKLVGIIYGKVNCCKCGFLYCETHVPFQMKLNQNAQHDPDGGIWARVCNNCYKSKEGYMDSNGTSRDWSREFTKVRKQKIESMLLESNLLEKRFAKLLTLYSNEKTLSRESSLSNMTLLLKGSSTLKQLEQSVTPWEKDSNSNSCHICLAMFNIINRRHHCRLCGLLTCQDCSNKLKLPVKQSLVEFIKVCLSCNSIMSRRNTTPPSVPSIVPLYQESVKVKNLILQILPLYNQKLMDLCNSRNFNTGDPDYVYALEIRKKLNMYFGELDKLGKRIKVSPTTSLSSQKLQDNISFSVIQFLQMHMFTLQLLPDRSSDKSWTHMENLQHEIQVLQEQVKQVEQYLVDATSKRRFEDAQMLKESLDELIQEIQRKKRELKE